MENTPFRPLGESEIEQIKRLVTEAGREVTLAQIREATVIDYGERNELKFNAVRAVEDWTLEIPLGAGPSMIRFELTLDTRSREWELIGLW